jgi:4-carboxymuconolactone decarboxylase
MRTLLVAGMLMMLSGATSFGQSPRAESGPARPTVLPPDIDPESLSRLPAIKRDEMDEKGKKAYDLLAGSSDSIKTGPSALALYSPEIAEPMRRLNQYLRFNGVADKRYRELAILIAIREMNQPYQWSGHEGGTLKAGVPQAVVDVVKYDKDVAGLEEKEATLIQVGRQLFRERRLSSELFARATRLFGKQGTVELVTVMGYYAMTALMLDAVDQHVPVEDGHHVAVLPDLQPVSSGALRNH